MKKYFKIYNGNESIISQYRNCATFIIYLLKKREETEINLKKILARNEIDTNNSRGLVDLGP